MDKTEIKNVAQGLEEKSDQVPVFDMATLNNIVSEESEELEEDSSSSLNVYSNAYHEKKGVSTEKNHAFQGGISPHPEETCMSPEYSGSLVGSSLGSTENVGPFQEGSSLPCPENGHYFLEDSSLASPDNIGPYGEGSSLAFPENGGSFQDSSRLAAPDNIGPYGDGSSLAFPENGGSFQDSSRLAAPDNIGPYGDGSSLAFPENGGSFRDNSRLASPDNIGPYGDGSSLASLDNAGSFQDGSSLASVSSQNDDMISLSENDVDSEKMEDTFMGKDDRMDAIDFNIKNRISVLHCYICGKHYVEPKLLNCLHSFCLECLDNLVFYKENERIECCVCGQKTCIPGSGMSDLPTNVVIKQLLDLNEDLEKDSYCDICILHGEEKKSSGQCVDCNDMLCSECCEKHTYSRLTISHTVVPLQDVTADNERCVVRLRENKVLSCSEHTDEKLKFYCISCQIVVCRDCVLLSHSSHQVLTTDKVIQKIKDDINRKVKELNQTKEKKWDELIKYEKLLEEKFDSEKSTLDTVYKEMITVVEEKYKVSLESLNEHYHNLRSRLEERKEKVEKNRGCVEDTEKNVTFLLNQGQDLEITNMESLIRNQLAKLKNSFENIKPYINTSSVLPYVFVYSNNCERLKESTLFKVFTRLPKGVPNRNDSTVSEKVGYKDQSVTTRLAKLGLDKQPKVAMTPAGMWPGIKTDNYCVQPGQKSLLGEPPLDFMKRKCSTDSDSSHQSQIQKPWMPHYGNQDTQTRMQHNTNNNHPIFGHKGRKGQPVRIPKAIGVNNETLSLHTTLSAKVLQDVYEPDIVGMTFVGRKDFAVCDARNKNVKIFSVCGKFLKVIIENEPMTITYCDGHLIWNGKTANVLIKSLEGGDRRVHKKQFQPDVTHPVAAFNDEKYLVANAQGMVVAFQVDGKNYIDGSPFITLCTGSMGMDRHVICELC